eukprot:512453_1
MSAVNCLQHKLEYLVTGYIREYILSTNHGIDTYESLLHQLIMHHLGVHIFTSFSPELMDPKMINICDNHTIKQIAEEHLGASALIDLPIAIEDEMCISWKIQIEAIKNGHNFPNYIYFIGITTNRCNNFDKSAHSGLTDAFGICGKGGSLKYNGNYISSGHKTFDHMDIVELQYNGKNKTLTFMNITDNKLIHVMELPKKSDTNYEETYGHITHWYPAVSTRDTGDIIRIIP